MHQPLHTVFASTAAARNRVARRFFLLLMRKVLERVENRTEGTVLADPHLYWQQQPALFTQLFLIVASVRPPLRRKQPSLQMKSLYRTALHLEFVKDEPACHRKVQRIYRRLVLYHAATLDDPTQGYDGDQDTGRLLHGIRTAAKCPMGSISPSL